MQQIRCDRCARSSDDRLTGSGWVRISFESYENTAHGGIGIFDIGQRADLCPGCAGDAYEWVRGLIEVS